MDLAWQAGDDVVRLEVGEPSFPTPPHIVDAAARAAASGHTKYLPNAGLPSLREALADKLVRRNRIAAAPDQIVVTNGAVQGLYAALALLTEPGDEVLLPDPSWPDYRMQAHLLGLGAVSYALRREHDFLPEPAKLEAQVGPRTRVLVLNTPSNPLGTVMPARLSAELVALAERHGLWVIADEVYDELVFEGEFVSVAAAAPSERVISLGSFSKVYAMTGWRVGYVAAPTGCAEILSALQEPLISCVNTPAQHAALAALTGPQSPVREMTEIYRHRRDVVLEELERLGLAAHRPSGAFYVWVDVSRSGLSGLEFALELLHRERVAVAPGSAFGRVGTGAVRLSLAADESALLEGVRRLARFVESTAAREPNGSRQLTREPVTRPPDSAVAGPSRASTEPGRRQAGQRERR